VDPNRQQQEAWNGGESRHYVEHADRYDRQLAPVTAAMLELAAVSGGHAVLDVGCGCGAMALDAAARAGSVLGVDISHPLIDVAGDRARRAGLDNARFLVADAQIHRFDPGLHDVVVSQFGLMFFDDPVGAFANLRTALVPRGRLVFATWQGLGANEWLSPVVDAVARFAEVPDLGGLANGPGMFALRDDSEIAVLLDDAGYRDIVVDAITPSLLLGGGGSVEEAADFLSGMGIVRGLLSHVADEDRDEAMAAVRAELERRYEPGVGVRLDAGVWLVSASA
jgi:SAM-dependent methyltransferase